MFKKIKEVFSRIFLARTFILAFVFFCMCGILVYRLFDLQIINGEDYLNNFTMQIKKERTLSSTRGNIYDRNGNLLAYNKLAFNVTVEDSGTYTSERIRNLNLNSIAYKLINMIESNGDSTIQEFSIIIDDSGHYAFAVEDFNLWRFKADAYGYKTIDELKGVEKYTTAEEMMDFFCSPKKFGLVDSNNKPEDYEAYGLPETFTMEETLKIVTIRNAIAANSYQKYIPSTIAEDVSHETAAVIQENLDQLEGVEVVEDTLRVYEDSIYFANIIGYTGKPNQTELEELLLENEEEYTLNHIVGKIGLEQVMETQLQGTSGKETVYVDNLGKELQTESIREPQIGNDVYLTIDSELQKTAYHLLEEKIASIILNHLTTDKIRSVPEGTKQSEIAISIYEVYSSLITNNVIHISHFAEDDATATEKSVLNEFSQKLNSVLATITSELESNTPVAYKNLTKEMQVYSSYIVSTLLMEKSGLLPEDEIDTEDPVYIDWKDNETISLKEFLEYAIAKNWIDASKFETENKYLDSDEIYSALVSYIIEYLETDNSFAKRVYRHMIFDDELSPTDLCLILFEQGVLDTDTDDKQSAYDRLISGELTPYSFMASKIRSLEITPAQLALEPCSGSTVITDVKTGEVLACVTYPGYDNNRLANTMDSEYYNELNTDGSTPFYNKATQQVTAPGSTFKPISGIAGISEGVITLGEAITCAGPFDKVAQPVKCWIHPGGHGNLTLSGAIGESCNVFFSETLYRMSQNSSGENDDDLGLQKLERYASMFGLTDKSGIEITETKGSFSNMDAVRSSIGQATHSYTTSQLAKYATGLANQGTVYDLTLIKSVKDSEENIVEEYSPTIYNEVELSSELWSAVRQGMNQVVNENVATKDITDIQWAGKTGTAEEADDKPNHSLFIGYAPLNDPEISVAVRIANGYTSKHAASIGGDIMKYYFELDGYEEIIKGSAYEFEYRMDLSDH